MRRDATRHDAGGSCPRRAPGQKTGLGKAPRGRPGRGGKGKLQQGGRAASTLSSSAHRALLHQPALGWASQRPRVVRGEGAGRPPPKPPTSSRGPCSSRARALPETPCGCSPQQRPGEERAELSHGSARGCPDATCRVPAAAAAPRDGWCRRAAGIPRAPWPGPPAGASSSTAGVHPRGSEGLSASFPRPTAAALHTVLVSFPAASPASPALGSACATPQMRPPGGTNPPYTYSFSESLPALLSDRALGAPCDFRGAFLRFMLGRKQALQQSYSLSFSPRSFACPGHGHSGKSSKPIPGRIAPATGTQPPGQGELLPARQSWPGVPRG